MKNNYLIPLLAILIGLSGCRHATSGSDLPYNWEEHRSFDVVPVEGGTFSMGSNDSLLYRDAYPEHRVTLYPFYIGHREIEFAQWEGIRVEILKRQYGYTDLPVGLNVLNRENGRGPLAKVSWYDALKWCNARSEIEGLQPVYYTDTTLTNAYKTGELNLTDKCVKWTANGYRLPTEAEWEFAARGGVKTHYFTYSGSNKLSDVAWTSQSPNGTLFDDHRIPNELFLWDMSGGMWEWCWDCYGPYGSGSQMHPKGASTGAMRVIRGGSFSSPETECRVASRTSANPGLRSASVGFRFLQKGSTP